MVAATIIDEHGKARYSIIPGKLWTFGIAGMALLLITVILLLGLIIYNKREIDGLRREVEAPKQEQVK